MARKEVRISSIKVDSAEYKHAISLPPGPGEPTKNVMRPGLRRPRTWCPLCNCWYYHDASGHDAWKKKKDAKEQQTTGTGTQPSTATVAAPAPPPTTSAGTSAGLLASVNGAPSDEDDDVVSSSVFGSLSPSWV